MPDSPDDQRLLQLALDLARQGVGLVSPNPCVGAVITDVQGNIAGTGTHTYAGVKHAEVLAIKAAGDKARGGTLYINLEPCSHQGRTPPCTDAVIAAGIRRVVASMADPNPQVGGRGFEKLRLAGVQVEVGRLADEALGLNESFARYIRSDRPFVTLKSAMTLDGKIAPDSAQEKTPRKTGDYAGTWITGEQARAHVHELRHRHDAILTGIGTVLSDNPLLTDRSGLPRRRPLLRLILDSQLRLPINSRLVRDVSEKKKDDVLVFHAPTDEKKKNELEKLGVRVEKIEANEHGKLALSAILRRLKELQITSVMIEGGSTINRSALDAGVVDKVFLYYAPKILGETAVPFLTNGDTGGVALVRPPSLHRFGEDVAIEGYLRDPYND